jgi:hypothetical protein
MTRITEGITLLGPVTDGSVLSSFKFSVLIVIGHRSF